MPLPGLFREQTTTPNMSINGIGNGKIVIAVSVFIDVKAVSFLSTAANWCYCYFYRLGQITIERRYQDVHSPTR